MSDPYVGEIRLFAGNFAPSGWNFCDGSQLAISEYSTLFNLIGTTYGGNGVTTFNLPDLRSRVPVHMGTSSTGTSYVIGQAAGTESVTLTTPQMPQHNHIVAATDQSSVLSPNNTLPAKVTSQQVASYLYGTGTATSLQPASILANSGGQAHNNLQPYLCASFIISLFGIYPSQS
jgi:microcystin-dependent protein